MHLERTGSFTFSFRKGKRKEKGKLFGRLRDLFDFNDKTEIAMEDKLSLIIAMTMGIGEYQFHLEITFISLQVKNIRFLMK